MTKRPLIPLDMPPDRLRALVYGLDDDGPITDARNLLTQLRISRLPDPPRDYGLEMQTHTALIDMAGVMARTYSRDVLALALVYGLQSALYARSKEGAGESLAALSASVTQEAGGWDLLLKHLAAWQQFDTLHRRPAARKPARKPKPRRAAL